MLRKTKHPFIPTPFREVGTVFIETGIRPVQKKGEKDVKCSRVSNSTESRSFSRTDNHATGEPVIEV
jgi:hypothetical protein